MMHQATSSASVQGCVISQSASVEQRPAFSGHNDMHAAMMHQCTSRHHADSVHAGGTFPSLHLLEGDRKCRDTGDVGARHHAPCISAHQVGSYHVNHPIPGPTTRQQASGRLNPQRLARTSRNHASCWLILHQATATTRNQAQPALSRRHDASGCIRSVCVVVRSRAQSSPHAGLRLLLSGGCLGCVESGVRSVAADSAALMLGHGFRGDILSTLPRCVHSFSPPIPPS
jgi:hypothetical protein